MAQVTTQEQQWGKRLAEAREAAGLSQFEAAVRLRSILPGSVRKPTNSTISRVENGAPTEVYVIAGLCQVYGIDLKAIAPELVADAEALWAILDKTAIIDLSGQEKPTSCWTTRDWFEGPIVDRRKRTRAVEILMTQNGSSGLLAKAS